jgi:hypothetical protein
MGQQIRHLMQQRVDAGVVPVTENGLLTEMVTDRDKVGDVTSAAAP